MTFDILKAFAEKPPSIDYVLPSLVSGTVGAIVSPGGTGKSMLALQLAVKIAGGADLLNLGEFPLGKVSYLPAEDPPLTIHHRLHAIGKHLLTEQKHKVAGNLLIKSLLGLNPNIAVNEWFEKINELAHGRRLLIIDTLRRFHNEDENSSGPMSMVIGKFEKIAADKGCSIVFLHHTNKSSFVNGYGEVQQGSRGSSVLVDNIRWQAYLRGITAEEVKRYGINENEKSRWVLFALNKVNYDTLQPEIWLERIDGGVLRKSNFKNEKYKKSVKQISVKEDDDDW